MRIAIFYNLVFGGAKRVVSEHVKNLKQLGHVVDVYTIDKENDFFDPGLFADNEYRYSYDSLSLKFPIFKRLLRDLSVFTILKQTHKKIAKDIDEKKYDVVLVHTDTFTQAPFILRYLKTKNLYFCLEPLRMVYEYALRIPDDLSFPNKVYEAINRYIRKNIDRTNAISAKCTTAISFFGRECMISSYNIFPKVSYLGVDIDKFKSSTKRKKNQILFVAEKHSLCGYDLVIEAMKLLPKGVKPELKIVSWTKNKKDRLKDEEMIKLYSESIATLSLNKFDTFGLVPLESMACGTPVIAFNVAGYRETMIDGKNGFLVEFNSQEIADKITYLLKNPEEARRLGESARKIVEQKWSWKKQVLELENILKAIKYENNKQV